MYFSYIIIQIFPLKNHVKNKEKKRIKSVLLILCKAEIIKLKETEEFFQSTKNYSGPLLLINSSKNYFEIKYICVYIYILFLKIKYV